MHNPESHKGITGERLEVYPRKLTAQQMREEVRDYLRQLWPQEILDPVVRCETLGTFSGTRGRKYSGA